MPTAAQLDYSTAVYLQNLQVFEQNFLNLICFATTFLKNIRSSTAQNADGEEVNNMVDQLAKFVTEGKVMLAEIKLHKLQVDLQQKQMNYETSLKLYRDEESKVMELKKTTEDSNVTRLLEILETTPDQTQPSPDTSNSQLIIDSSLETCSAPPQKKRRISPDSTPLETHIIVSKNSSNKSRQSKRRKKNKLISTSTQTDQNWKWSTISRRSSTPLKFDKATETNYVVIQNSIETPAIASELNCVSPIEKSLNKDARSEVKKSLKDLTNPSTSRKESNKPSAIKPATEKATKSLLTLPEPSHLTFVGIQIQNLPSSENSKEIACSGKKSNPKTISQSANAIKDNQLSHKSGEDKTRSDVEIAECLNPSTTVQRSNCFQSLKKSGPKKPPTTSKLNKKSAEKSKDTAPSVSQVATTQTQPAKSTAISQNKVAKDVFKIPLQKSSTISPLTTKQKDWERFKEKAKSQQLKLNKPPTKKIEDSKSKEALTSTVPKEPVKNLEQAALPPTNGSVTKENSPPTLKQVPDQCEKSKATAEIIALLASIEEKTKASPFNFANVRNSTKNVKITPFVPRSCPTSLPQNAKTTPSVCIKANVPIVERSHFETTSASNKPSVCVKDIVNIPVVGTTRSETNTSRKILDTLSSKTKNAIEIPVQIIEKHKSDSALTLTEPSIAKYDSTPSLSKGMSQNSKNSDIVIKPLPISRALINKLRAQRFPNVKKQVVSFTQSIKDIEIYAKSQQKLGVQLKSKPTSIMKNNMPTLRKRSKSLVILSESQLTNILNKPDDVYSKVMSNNFERLSQSCSKLPLVRSRESTVEREEIDDNSDKNVTGTKSLSRRHSLLSQFTSNLDKLEHPTEKDAQEIFPKLTLVRQRRSTLFKMCNKTDNIFADTTLHNQDINSDRFGCPTENFVQKTSLFPDKLELTHNSSDRMETENVLGEKNPFEVSSCNTGRIIKEPWVLVPQHFMDTIPKDGIVSNFDPPSTPSTDIDNLMQFLKDPNGNTEPLSQSIIDLILERMLKNKPLSKNLAAKESKCI